MGHLLRSEPTALGTVHACVASQGYRLDEGGCLSLACDGQVYGMVRNARIHVEACANIYKWAVLLLAFVTQNPCNA